MLQDEKLINRNEGKCMTTNWCEQLKKKHQKVDLSKLHVEANVRANNIDQKIKRAS